MDKLFGTNGVRGVFSEDFTLEFVHDLVLAISTYFKEGRILVGYDGRDSSVVVSKLGNIILLHGAQQKMMIEQFKRI
jgi:phosphomannomutase/phosphoglucomutase